MQVEGYTLGRPLGRGATATVYEARRGAETVAVKLYSGTRSMAPPMRRRVQTELQTLSRLEHPSIVRLRAAGEVEGQLYVVMDLVQGESLQARISREGRLPEGESRELVRSLAGAVDYLHRCGVLHRDIKPDNVLLSPQGALLTDFGLARDLHDAGERLTVSGALLGTPGYLAPEQASGRRERVGKPADVYGLGGVLYACLTGGPPVAGESMPEVISATAQGQIRPPRELRPDLDPDLERICMGCLTLEPRDRPSAEALARELAGATRPRAGIPLRSLAWAAVGALALVAVAVFGALLVQPKEPSPERLARFEERIARSLEERKVAARELIRDFPESAAGYYQLARHYAHTTNNWELAREHVELALERDATHSDAWLLGATVYGMLGQEGRRVEALDRAVELDPPQGLLRRANYLASVKQFEAAERDLHAWIKLKPEEFQAWSSLGRVLSDQARWPEAAEAFGNAIDFAPEDQFVHLYRERAKARKQSQDYEGSLADIVQSADYSGGWNLGLYAEQAELLTILKRYPEAAVAYRNALEIYPHQALWVFTLHKIERRLGNSDEAAKLLVRAHDLSRKTGVHPQVKRQIEEAWAAAQGQPR